ncbi:hypothetical protein OOU_Y34scaffold00153g10 [Pyricularia oryzae Y34]|uniref:Uncharacterized protein n=2 Tax=Pyricularia oryzae TaxID=318829 RepID=A0AA97P7E6_PYRO3|nr:hypothetical protein OOU_Y34scaffold00153g10 [Pyricularia oryzae Y34]
MIGLTCMEELNVGDGFNGPLPFARSSVM